jgi:gluconate 2-dehydrogenase subunit 3-like protein
VGLLSLVPTARLAQAAETLPAPGQPGRFLTAAELDTLRAVTARLVPGPPDDPDPGALEARAAEAIDMLLGAFTFDPPLIHAGGPFSGRFGGGHDDFAEFVAMDRLVELGWRIRLEGTLGRRDREFAGPVRGLQQLYREDLAHLDQRARQTAGMGFASLPSPVQDTLLTDPSDSQTQELVGAALANTLEAVYGAPEYGGNHGLVGWRPLNWPGDVQPRGYSPAQVSEPDPNGAPRPAVSRATATRILEQFLPFAGGRPAPAGAWWQARRGVPHG